MWADYRGLRMAVAVGFCLPGFHDAALIQAAAVFEPMRRVVLKIEKVADLERAFAAFDTGFGYADRLRSALWTRIWNGFFHRFTFRSNKNAPGAPRSDAAALVGCRARQFSERVPLAVVSQAAVGIREIRHA